MKRFLVDKNEFPLCVNFITLLILYLFLFALKIYLLILLIKKRSFISPFLVIRFFLKKRRSFVQFFVFIPLFPLIHPINSYLAIKLFLFLPLDP